MQLASSKLKLAEKPITTAVKLAATAAMTCAILAELLQTCRRLIRIFLQACKLQVVSFMAVAKGFTSFNLFYCSSMAVRITLMMIHRCQAETIITRHDIIARFVP
jgi:hypothetical protein